MGIINCGSSIPISQSQSDVPNVNDTLNGYYQSMTFTTTVKTVVNMLLTETPTSTAFRGVWQPLSNKALSLKPEGQRSWSWFMCHSDICLNLIPDQIITYNTVQYRVMGEKDYSLYGYWYYELVQDYTGAGP